MAESELLIDRHLPRYDVQIAVHQLVDADPHSTWLSARELDLLTVHTPLMDAAMFARGLPARLTGREAPVPPKLTFAGDDGALPGWLKLGEQPDVEITLGAVGKFWQANIEWRDVGLGDFAAFAEPGWGKIAAALVVTRYGERRSIVTYDCRTATNDPESRRRFERYWWLIQPFVGHIMRATLTSIARDAPDRQRALSAVRSG